MKVMKVEGTYSLPYTIKAEWTAYLMFTILFGPIALIAMVIGIMEPSMWLMSLICIAVLGTFLFWVANFKIEIQEDRIVYNTLFSKANEILFLNICNVEIEIGLRSKSHKKHGFYRLNIYDAGDFRKQPLTINMKPFSQKDLAIVVDAIARKAPSVKADKRTQELMNGDFKPIIHEGIRQILLTLLWVLGLFLFINIIQALIRIMN